MYDRVIAMGGHAPRPLMPGGPALTEAPKVRKT
jgi:hypothetical protein